MLSKSHFFMSLFILCTGCIELEEDSCSEYVDYMCNCHADDPNYNCSELKNLYQEPDAATQEQCALMSQCISIRQSTNGHLEIALHHKIG